MSPLATIETLLAHGDVERRRHGLDRLAERDLDTESDARQLLLRALGDSDWRVRRDAVELTRRVSNELLLDELIAAVVQRDNVGLRNAAIEALARSGDVGVARMRRALDEEAPHAKKFLLEALGEARAIEALPDIIARVSDPDTNVAIAALEALGRLGDASVRDALRDQLSPADPVRCMAVLDALERMSAEVEFDVLQPLLADRLIRRGATPLLARAPEPAARRQLIDFICAGRPRALVKQALLALDRNVKGASGRGAEVAAVLEAQLEPELPGLPVVRELLEADDPTIRSAAAHFLVLGRDVESLPMVMETCHRQSAEIERIEPGEVCDLTLGFSLWGLPAVHALLDAVAEGGARAIALGQAVQLVRLANEQGGGSIRDARTRLLESLRRACVDDSLRAAAVRGLGHLGEASDAPVLLAVARVAGGPDTSVAAEALEALGEREPVAVQDVLGGVSLASAETNPRLAHVVAHFANDPQEALAEGLRSPDPEMRRAAIRELTGFAGTRGVELVAYALSDEDPEVRLASVRALGQHPEAEVAAPALERALGADAPEVRVEAARGLVLHVERGGISAERAARTLGEFLRREALAVEVVAGLAALRRIGKLDFVEHLDRLLASRDTEVVKEALRFAAEVGGERGRIHLLGGLTSETWHVRLEAARLLLAEGSSVARASLEEHRKRESDPMVAQTIDRGLRSS